MNEVEQAIYLVQGKVADIILALVVDFLKMQAVGKECH